MSDKGKYVVNEGANFQKQPAGTVVELTDRQARAFADLVTSLAVVRAKATMAATLAGELEANADDQAEAEADASAEPVVVDVTDPAAPVVVEPSTPAIEPNTANQKDTLKAIRGADTILEVESIGDGEQARGDDARPTVLEAVDKRLERLERLEAE